MGITFNDPTSALKKIAIEYFHNGLSVNETIHEIIRSFEAEDDIIKNQLAYYPI